MPTKKPAKKRAAPKPAGKTSPKARKPARKPAVKPARKASRAPAQRRAVGSAKPKAQTARTLSAFVFAVPDGVVAVVAPSKAKALLQFSEYWLWDTTGEDDDDAIREEASMIADGEEEDVILMGKGKVLGHGGIVPCPGLELITGVACRVGVVREKEVHIWPASHPTPAALAKAELDYFTYDGDQPDSVWPEGYRLTIL